MSDTTAPTQGRKLNMEEKRKLEKMLLDDIDIANSAYNTRRSQERSALAEKIVAYPPREVKTALRNHQRANELKDRAEQQLHAMGYGFDYQHKLAVGYSIKPKVLEEFDAATNERSKQLAEAKRTYTMKLFAGGEEAKELFASLAKELAAIIK